MNKKFYLCIISVVVIIVIGVILVLTGTIDDNATVDSASWETKELVGVKFKLPPKYAMGTLISGNTVNGKFTGNCYQSQNGDFFIYIFQSKENSSNWNKELKEHMNNDTNSIQIIEINKKEIKIFKGNDGYSTGFFKVKNDKICIKWKGDFNNNIKEIINNLFTLNS
ncbi:hypothetical protein [Methanobrevibacter filiformis]|uniref:DUF4367 domain-containing protein n=1 Tax=Methanobrevibacter filiformis TaxID=55758 RepID=A0A162FLF1_9EURY|nr:hypothetical protein [Methanobrevibacter filiformis]KZX11760.1 hypothetical protein MBFIL_13220 [Methanobrevibacter filiformis]